MGELNGKPPTPAGGGPGPFTATRLPLRPGRSLDPEECRLLVLTLGADAGWDRTVPADGPLARRLGGGRGEGPALRGDGPIRDRRMGALRDFALEILRTGGRPSGAGLRTFLAAGFSRGDVLEVVRTVTAHAGPGREAS